MRPIIYTKTGCPWCKEALELLNARGVPYEEREVRGSEEYMQELIAKSGQDKTPTLDVGGEILADTDAPAIEAFLKQKGMLSAY